jgi:hypothetical protein
MISDGTRWLCRKASNYRADFRREMAVIAGEYEMLLEKPHPFDPMKNLSALIAACLLGAVIAAAAAEPPADSERDQQQAAALAKEVQAQQTAIADNQTKIDAKMVTIAEALRLAKIYASRAGR